MKKNLKLAPRFGICVKSDDSDLLTPRMIYRILPDARAAQSNFVRVLDNEGEDYLYPANYFVLMSFPLTIERTLVRISKQFVPSGTGLQKRRTVSALKRKTKPSAA
jgi:hypothetical protein